MIFRVKSFIILFFIFFIIFSCEKKEKLNSSNNSGISIDIVLPQTTSLYSCYLTGETIKFTANIKSLEEVLFDTPVTWEVDKGVISNDGEYTAPTYPCTVKVTARFKDVFNSVNIKIVASVPNADNNNFYFLVDSIIPSTNGDLDERSFWAFGNKAQMEKLDRNIFIDGGVSLSTRVYPTETSDRRTPGRKYYDNVSKTEYMNKFFGGTDNSKNFTTVKGSDAFEGNECFKMRVPRPADFAEDNDEAFYWSWLGLMFSIHNKKRVPERWNYIRYHNGLLLDNTLSFFYESGEGEYSYKYYKNLLYFLFNEHNKLHFAYRIDEKDPFEPGSRLRIELKGFSAVREEAWHLFGELFDETRYLLECRYPIATTSIELKNDVEWHVCEILIPKRKQNYENYIAYYDSCYEFAEDIMLFASLNFILLNTEGMRQGTLYIDDVYFFNDEV